MRVSEGVKYMMHVHGVRLGACVLCGLSDVFAGVCEEVTTYI